MRKDALQVVTEEKPSSDELQMVVEVVGYQKTQKEYAEFYGSSVRTVKSWVKKGKDAGELPPLDDPCKFVIWWETYQKHKVPVWLLEAAGTSEASREVSEPSNVFNPEVTGAFDLSELDEVEDGGLEMMKKIVAVNGKKVVAAYAKGIESEIQSAEARYQKSIASLRALEKTQVDLAKASGGLMSKDEILMKIGPKLAMLGDSVLEAMVKAVQRGNPEIKREEARMIAIEERDSCFRVVKGDLLA